MLQSIGYTVQVPGNVSRYFASASEARTQRSGTVDLAWDTEDPLIFNRAFDASLVRHDSAYCTSSAHMGGGNSLPTAEYFGSAISAHLGEDARVVDVGCGQGEFVEWLRARGVKASGYDPVLRRPSDYLFPRYWTGAEPQADLYVMRCVLPHIPDPWAFLTAMWESSPDALIHIEYQRLEFILEHDLWFQVSHDHVNQFRLSDFTDRFEVRAHGEFSEGEWQWVLLSPGQRRRPQPRPFDAGDDIARLARSRQATLARLAALDEPLAIWGAAGKGAAIAHALVGAGVEGIVAIDADPHKDGVFMEGSGVEVMRPDRATETLPRGTRIVVANPHHVADVSAFVGDRFDVSCASDWGASDWVDAT